MFRKLGVAGLVTGAALGTIMAASPAQAHESTDKHHDHPPVYIINYQEQSQEANSESNAEAANVNEIDNESSAGAISVGLAISLL